MSDSVEPEAVNADEVSEPPATGPEAADTSEGNTVSEQAHRGRDEQAVMSPKTSVPSENVPHRAFGSENLV